LCSLSPYPFWLLVQYTTATSHTASLSLLSTASLKSAIALLMLLGNGLDQDLAQYCSMHSNFVLTCSTVWVMWHFLHIPEQRDLWLQLAWWSNM
jgi:hypothetical protein